MRGLNLKEIMSKSNMNQQGLNIATYGQAYWHNPLIFSAILVLFHPTSGYSEIQFYFEIHSEIAEKHVSGFNR